MIDVGILTPHGAAGADDELAVMAGGDVRTLVWSINESLGTPLEVRGFGRLLAPREDHT